MPDLLDPADAAARPALRRWLASQLSAQRNHRAPPPGPGELDRGLAQLLRCRARGIPRGSRCYPAALERIPDPPALLWVRGRIEALEQPAVAVVGARAASRYGERVAADFAGVFARAGLCVVSGLARGIDAAAHRGALAAGGVSVAVQGCGPDRVFPAGHRGLAEELARDGCVLSELPPGSPPRKAHFPLRNRLISGLSLAVVVVEARLRSGSLVTARHALDQGLDVFAVPGPIDAPASQGTNQLLWDGAWPALDPFRVLRKLGVRGPATPAEQAAEGRGGAEAHGEQGRLRARIERQLGQGPLARDELARALELSPEQLALPLLELELSGRVLAERDGRLRLCPGPGRETTGAGKR